MADSLPGVPLPQIAVYFKEGIGRQAHSKRTFCLQRRVGRVLQGRDRETSAQQTHLLSPEAGRLPRLHSLLWVAINRITHARTHTHTHARAHQESCTHTFTNLGSKGGLAATSASTVLSGASAISAGAKRYISSRGQLGLRSTASARSAPPGRCRQQRRGPRDSCTNGIV